MPLNLTGPTSTRDGRLRHAITELIRLAKEHRCAGIAAENLGFTDARHTGRETMGRGQRGKRFRRTVHGTPTARFRERLRGMAFHAGSIVVAVDAAYTSRWGAKTGNNPCGAVVGSREAVDHLRHHARSLSFTATHTPAQLDPGRGRRDGGAGRGHRTGVVMDPGWRTGDVHPDELEDLLFQAAPVLPPDLGLGGGADADDGAAGRGRDGVLRRSVCARLRACAVEFACAQLAGHDRVHGRPGTCR